MKSYILLSSKKWHFDLYSKLSLRENEQWILINSNDSFKKDTVDKIAPDRVFVPHWSHIIPESIWSNYECIVFHMTDLPFGRGGSPLQNLIVRGVKETKISALRVNDGIDTGDIYLKKPLPLYGTAEEIFLRSIEVIEEMIKAIISEDLIPTPQEGQSTLFKRRKPKDSDVSKLTDMEKLYDHIRMLDCDGYPPAFFETDVFRFEFTRASMKGDKSILADVRIIKK